MTSFALISSIRSFGGIRRTTIVLLAVIFVQLCTALYKFFTRLRWCTVCTGQLRNHISFTLFVVHEFRIFQYRMVSKTCLKRKASLNARTRILTPTPITSTYIPHSTVSAWASRATCSYLVATVVSDFKHGIVAEIRTSSECTSIPWHPSRAEFCW